jgi:hypothetical protein
LNYHGDKRHDTTLNYDGNKRHDTTLNYDRDKRQGSLYFRSMSVTIICMI